MFFRGVMTPPPVPTGPDAWHLLDTPSLSVVIVIVTVIVCARFGQSGLDNLWRPLWRPLSRSSHGLFTCQQLQWSSMTRDLVSSGLNIHQMCTQSHATLLYQAAYSDTWEIAEYLVEAGVDVEAPAIYLDDNTRSHTPLHIAALLGNHRMSLVVSRSFLARFWKHTCPQVIRKDMLNISWNA